MATPLKRLTTIRSVVAARAGTPAQAIQMPASRQTRGPIKAIPGRKGLSSCRCAVIVAADNISSRGDIRCNLERACWRQVKGSDRVRYQGFFYDFRITSRCGRACRADRLDRAGLRPDGGPAARSAAAAAEPDAEHLWAGRTGERRPPLLRQRLARARL